MDSYTLGFMFSKDGSKVSLIRKTKPDWQKGKLNGIGGKLEYKENFFDAMVREFEEEAGVKTSFYDWKHVCVLKSRSFFVAVYASFDDRVFDVATKTDEEVGVYSVHEVLQGGGGLVTVPSVPWIIGLTLDPKWRSGEMEFVSVLYAK